MLRRAAVLLLLAAACGSLKGANDDPLPPPPPGSTSDAGPTNDDASSDDDDDLVVPSDGGTETHVPPGQCDAACPVEDLGSGRALGAITVDDANVYFVSTEGAGSGVYQCPKTGCSGAPTFLGPGTPEGVVVAGDDVIWADRTGGRILSCAHGGCGGSPTVLASDENQVHGVWGRDGVVFWTANDTPAGSGATIRKCAPAACTPAPVTGTLPFAPSNVAVGPGPFVIAFVTGSSVRTCNVGDCSGPAILGTGVENVSLSGFDALWVQQDAVGAVVACTTSGCASKPTKLGSSPLPHSPQSDGHYTYWRDTNESIFRCPFGGCGSDNAAREIFVEHQSSLSSGITPVTFTFDAAYVYWTTASAVRRRHK